MRAAAARRRDPAAAPRLCRSGGRCGEAPPTAAFEGEGMSSALNSREVNSSHSRDREKWGAWLCRLASEVASATRPCMRARCICMLDRVCRTPQSARMLSVAWCVTGEGAHLLQEPPQQARQHRLALWHGLKQRQLRVRIVGGASLRVRRAQGRAALR